MGKEVLWREREEQNQRGHGRYIREDVEGNQGVLAEKRVPETKWVGSAKEEQGGAGKKPEAAVLADQNLPQDPIAEDAFPQEAAAVAEGLLRQNDDEIGQLPSHERECGCGGWVRGSHGSRGRHGCLREGLSQGV